MKLLLFFSLLFIASCMQPTEEQVENALDTAIPAKPDHLQVENATPAEVAIAYNGNNRIVTGNTSPQAVVEFAQTLIGTPYKYASIDRTVGFDCSGFITYVFNRFNIAVPRSSKDFTNIQHEVSLQDAKPGDIILFTGTDSSIRVVGHMGIITANNNGAIQFIHSTSGKQYGVTITPLEKYYMGRFMKVIRIFAQNDT